MKFDLLVCIPFIVGAMMAVQGALNAQLGIVYKHAAWGTFVNFSGGLITVILFGAVLYGIGQMGEPDWERAGKLPFYFYLGGIIGAAMVTTVVFLVPRIGMTSIFAGLIVGQLVGVLVIDHFGLLRVAVRPITLPQLLGVCLLLAGLVLVNMRSSPIDNMEIDYPDPTIIEATTNSNDDAG